MPHLAPCLLGSGIGGCFSNPRFSPFFPPPLPALPPEGGSFTSFSALFMWLPVDTAFRCWPASLPTAACEEPAARRDRSGCRCAPSTDDFTRPPGALCVLFIGVRPAKFGGSVSGGSGVDAGLHTPHVSVVRPFARNFFHAILDERRLSANLVALVFALLVGLGPSSPNNKSAGTTRVLDVSAPLRRIIPHEQSAIRAAP